MSLEYPICGAGATLGGVRGLGASNDVSFATPDHLTHVQPHKQVQPHKVDHGCPARSKHVNMRRLTVGWLDDDPQASRTQNRGHE